MILVVLFCNKLGHYLVSTSNPRGHLKVSGKLLIQGNAKMFLNPLLLAGCPLDRFTKNFFWKFKKWIVNSMEDYKIKHVRIFFWSQMSLLHKVLDPPSYTRDLQRAKFWKSILGHNFWMEGPMDLNSTPLSYIFNALFRDTPLAHLLLRHVCHICHVTCVIYITCETLRKVGKWGIPEKSIKNVAQRRWI